MQFKLYLLSFCLFIGAITFAQNTQTSFSITVLKPYCGGARPSLEMEENARTPQVYPGKKIVLVNSKGKSWKLVTDSNGVITCKLKAGDYKLYELWRFTKKTPDGSSKKRYECACLKSEWTKEFAKITVTSVKSEYTVTNDIFEPCEYAIPCMLDAFKPQPPE